ncbi:MAG: thioredoxin family protein [Arcobacteraceae bacterium]
MYIEDIEKEIRDNDAVMLYFSGKNCGVCTALKPKIQSAFQENFPKIKQIFISADEYPEIAAHFSIFTIPSILVFFDAKETRRESRHISVDQLVQVNKRHYTMFFN